MSFDKDKFNAALAKVAKSKDFAGVFIVKRLTSSGTPPYWEEIITYVHGKDQSYSTIRSAVDEGNVPIGQWSCPYEKKRTVELAKALREVKFADLENGDIEPGQEYVSFSVTVDTEKKTLNIPAGSSVFMNLGALEISLRSIANTTQAEDGAGIKCEVNLTAKGASLSILNSGNKDCFIVNPLPLPDNMNFIRIELAKNDPDSSLGLIYQPFNSMIDKTIEENWKSKLIEVKAGKTVKTPIYIEFDKKTYANFFIRGVFSSYRKLPAKGILVRGRTFSTETLMIVIS